MHRIAAFPHLSDGVAQRLLHGFQTGEDGANFVFAVDGNRPRQIAAGNVVKVTADDLHWLNHHMANPPQRADGDQYRNNHHANKGDGRTLVVALTFAFSGSHVVLDIFAPAFVVVIKLVLRFLYRCRHKLCQLVVLKPGRLMG